MLEIWGRPYSSNVIPVIWAANELGLEYTLQLAGGSFGKLDTPEYALINPNRMIPAIRDGDFALWESLAIVRYLCDRYSAGGLSPADRKPVLLRISGWNGQPARRSCPSSICFLQRSARNPMTATP